MLKIQQHLNFVKRQLDYQMRQRDRAYAKFEAKVTAGGDGAPEKHKALLHEKIVAELTGLIESMIYDIEHADETLAALGPRREERAPGLADLFESPTSLTPAQLRDLPPDLIQQLQISESDKFQWDVVDLIGRAHGQTMSIEVLLIALYRLSGKVYERTDLSNRLYRLTKKQAIYTVQGRKGFYTTRIDTSGQFEFNEDQEADVLTR